MQRLRELVTMFNQGHRQATGKIGELTKALEQKEAENNMLKSQLSEAMQMNHALRHQSASLMTAMQDNNSNGGPTSLAPMPFPQRPHHPSQVSPPGGAQPSRWSMSPGRVQSMHGGTLDELNLNTGPHKRPREPELPSSPGSMQLTQGQAPGGALERFLLATPAMTLRGGSMAHEPYPQINSSPHGPSSRPSSTSSVRQPPPMLQSLLPSGSSLGSGAPGKR